MRVSDEQIERVLRNADACREVSVVQLALDLRDARAELDSHEADARKLAAALRFVEAARALAAAPVLSTGYRLREVLEQFDKEAK